MTCDTCGRQVTWVSRVVIDRGYNRADAKPLWNCSDCFQRKEQERLRQQAKADSIQSRPQ